MKSIKFYSLHNMGRGIEVNLHEGYTDGTYNYYEHCGKWFAIHPKTGLAVVIKDTIEDAAEYAHREDIIKHVAEFYEVRGREYEETLNNLVAKIKKESNETIHVVEAVIKRFYKVYVEDEDSSMTNEQILAKAKEMILDDQDNIDLDIELDIEDHDIVSLAHQYDL